MPDTTDSHWNSLPVQRCKGISMLYNNAGCTTTLNRRLCVWFMSASQTSFIKSFHYFIRDYLTVVLTWPRELAKSSKTDPKQKKRWDGGVDQSSQMKLFLCYVERALHVAFWTFHGSEEILMTPKKKKNGTELVGPIIWNDYLCIMLIKCYQSTFLLFVRISRMLYNTPGLVLIFLSLWPWLLFGQGW